MLNMVLMEVPEKAAVQLYSFAEWPPLRKRKSPQYSAERPLTQTASRWKIKAFLSHQAQLYDLEQFLNPLKSLLESPVQFAIFITMGSNSSSESKKKDSSPTSLAKRQDLDNRIVTDLTTKGLFEEEWKLSVEDKELLQKSWIVLRSNLQSLGVVTLLKLFETHPETLRPFIQEVYTLKELELNEWYREKLRVHALRVMSVVEKTMHRLNEETKAGLILMNYGHRHQDYGVTPGMLRLMGKCFVVSVQPTLEEAAIWDSKMESAWMHMFRFITFFMILGYSENNLKYEEGQNGELNYEYIKDSSEDDA